MFLVNSIPARVMFDSGASHFFVTENFVKKGKLESTMMTRDMLVQIPGSVVKTKDNCVDVPVDIHGVSFRANLIILGTKGLDVVLGMDWMSKYQGHIDCTRKSIAVTNSDGIRIEHVATMPFRKAYYKKSVSGPTLNQVPVVCEYPDVFPKELLGMPPGRDIEFIGRKQHSYVQGHMLCLHYTLCLMQLSVVRNLILKGSSDDSPRVDY
jgi:hypothetical protein